MNRRLGTAVLALVALICGLLSIAALADSQARIVRLSDVQGSVKIDRNLGQGYEKAFLNTPITQGMKLQTGVDSRAEVEFEDGSVIHMTPGTVLVFNDLGLRDSGGKVSTVEVQEGQAYFNVAGKKDDEFSVSFAHQKAALTQAAHFRVQVNDTDASLAVFTGDVIVGGPAGETQVGKKQTATFDLLNNTQTELDKNIESDPFDAWDKQESQYHERYTSSNSTNGMPAYGMSDLAYYGNYMNVPGYGMMWQPYFAGAGWDPFMDGAWMWYPGFGYTWVSAYPWGWLPYHYGGWQFVPGFGWFWNPGTTFLVFNPVTPVIRPPVHYVPPRPPLPASHSTVMVGRGLAPSSAGLLSGHRSTVMVRGANAGLGVPRGISNLSRMNREFAREGVVALPSSTRVTSGGIHAGMAGGTRLSGTSAAGSHMSTGTHATGSTSSGHASSSHSGSHH
jgi:FecR protein